MSDHAIGAVCNTAIVLGLFALVGFIFWLYKRND